MQYMANILAGNNGPFIPGPKSASNGHKWLNIIFYSNQTAFSSFPKTSNQLSSFPSPDPRSNWRASWTSAAPKGPYKCGKKLTPPPSFSLSGKGEGDSHLVCWVRLKLLAKRTLKR